MLTDNIPEKNTNDRPTPGLAPREIDDAATLLAHLVAIQTHGRHAAHNLSLVVGMSAQAPGNSNVHFNDGQLSPELTDTLITLLRNYIQWTGFLADGEFIDVAPVE